MCWFKKKTPIQEDDPIWLKAAIGELGIKEIPGKEHNPRILTYHKCTSLESRNDETAWCSAFINWCFKQSGLIGTNKANARSWLEWGRSLNKPKRGCVVVFWRSSPNSWMGHVALYIKEDEKYIHVLGGNQNNEVNISKYPKERLLGYRWVA